MTITISNELITLIQLFSNLCGAYLIIYFLSNYDEFKAGWVAVSIDTKRIPKARFVTYGIVVSIAIITSIIVKVWPKTPSYSI